MIGFKVVFSPEEGLYHSAWAGYGGFPVLPYRLAEPTVSPLEWIFYFDLSAPVSHVASLLLPSTKMAVLLIELDDKTISISRVVKREDSARSGEYWRSIRVGEEPVDMDLGLVLPFTRASPVVTPLRILWSSVWDNSYGQWEALGNALSEARDSVPDPDPVVTDKNIWFPIARA